MKMYTLDGALLTETPEIRIGDHVYKVDNRQKTVKKMTALDASDPDTVEKTMALALGSKAAKEIEAMDLPFPAYQKLMELVIAAMTGEEPEAVERRFQAAKDRA